MLGTFSQSMSLPQWPPHWYMADCWSACDLWARFVWLPHKVVFFPLPISAVTNNKGEHLAAIK